MKIRNGFVSNSSTSSFLIYGVTIEDEKFIEAVKKKYPDAVKGYIEGEFNKYTAGYTLDEKTKLSVKHPYEGGCGIYVGRSWDSIEDNQTGGQFKDEISKQLKELFGDDIKLDTYQEAWYD